MALTSSFQGISNQTFADFGGAASDLLSGFATEKSDETKAAGLRSEASDYRLAAGLAGENEQYTELSTSLKSTAEQRRFQEINGKTVATIAGSGVSATSGDALDIIRSNAQQGAIAQQTIGAQGFITEEGYKEQQLSYNNMAATADQAAEDISNAGKSAGFMGEVTGGIKGLAGIASLFMA